MLGSATGAIDWIGSLSAVVALGALTYALSSMSTSGADPLLIGGALAIGIAGTALFVSVERRAENPVASPALFRSRVFTVVNVVTVLLYGALSGVLFLLPFDLLSRRGLSATEAGLVLLPLGIIIGIFSRYAGSLADTYGARIFLAVGSAIVAVGCLGFASGLDNLWVGAVVPLVVLSGGIAIVVSPLTTAVMNAAPDDKAGAASGVSNAASRLAGVLAIALLGTTAGVVFAWLAPEGSRFGVLPEVGTDLRAAATAAFVSAYATAMILAALWAAVAAALAFHLLPDTGRGRSRPAAEGSGRSKVRRSARGIPRSGRSPS